MGIKDNKGKFNKYVIDRLLFEGLNDNGASVDCIIVLGSLKAAKYRVPVAAEAFFSGRSENILLCGGKIRNFSSERMTEADNMYQKALELGVPESNIIIERSSQNTIENILCSLVELQRSMCLNKVKSVLLVTTTYHIGLLTKSDFKIEPFHKVLKNGHYFVMPLQLCCKNLLDFSEQDFVNSPIICAEVYI